MKRKDKKLTTLLLAGALSVSAVFGAVALNDGKVVSADESKAQTYALTDIFSATSATLDAEKLGEESAKTAKFTVKDGGKVAIKRNLAFKWAQADGAKYLSMTYAFGAMSFKTVDFVMESESSLTEENAKNILRFEKNDKGEGVLAYVVQDGASEEEIEAAKEEAANAPLAIAVNEEFTVAFAEAEGYDQFDITVNGTKVGTFTHVGKNYANNPLSITAKDAEAVVYLDEINGQKFNNIVTEGEGDSAKQMIADTAAPVIVANETLNTLLFGAKFDFSYTAVDVLETPSNVKEVDKYYQYNPTDTEVSYVDVGSSRYFMDTVYKKEDGTQTSVYREDGQEYVSIQVTVSDKTYKDDEGDYAKVVYDLAWYAEEGATVTKEAGKEDKKKDVQFILVTDSREGAKYIEWSEEEFAAYKANYQDKLEKAAAKVFAGTSATMDLPSLDNFIEDDNGYKGLRFTICYKTETSSNLTKGPVAYNALKIPTTSVGHYEFRVLATDKAGNAMKAVLDDEEVEVTTSNIWDFDESQIPTFAFKVANQGLKVEEDANADDEDRTVKKVLDQSYSLSGLKVVGGSNQQSAFALYKVDTSKYNSKVEGSEKQLNSKLLASIGYDKIRGAMLNKLSDVKEDKYLELYLDTYAELLAKEVGATKEDILPCFTAVNAYDADIESDDNAYEWQKSGSSTFTTAEEGEYLIFADYWDSLLPTVSRAVAYKLVVVESKVDTIKGETEWLKNNIVSVILFSIAGVLLIIIIVLLLIKPSDETLEDVDKEAKKEKEPETDK